MENKPSKMRDITKAEFIKRYKPGPGMLLIDKDEGTEFVGRIVMPKSIRDKSARNACAGRIVKVSPYEVYQESYDKDLYAIYKEGMHVGFNPTTPWAAPSPPYIKFIKEAHEPEIDLVIIHMADIIAVYDFEGL